MLQIQVPAVRQSGDEHSSYAIDSVSRFSGDTETDAEHQEDPEDCRDRPRCAKTVPVIQESQKIVELSQVLFMDEVVGIPVVMEGKCVRLRRAEHLEVATDSVLRHDLWCSRGDATPGSHSSSVTNNRCLWFRCAARRTVELPQAQHTERDTDIAVARQHQASVIQTVQETGEVPQSQLDRLVDVLVGIQRQTTDDPDVPMNTRSRSGR